MLNGQAITWLQTVGNPVELLLVGGHKVGGVVVGFSNFSILLQTTTAGQSVLTNIAVDNKDVVAVMWPAAS